VVNEVITTSSSEMVKARSQPDRIAGEMTGRVMSNSTCQGRAAKVHRRLFDGAVGLDHAGLTMVVTKTIEKVICAKVTVVNPRCSGPADPVGHQDEEDQRWKSR
jgi:hypothetical protein